MNAISMALGQLLLRPLPSDETSLSVCRWNIGLTMVPLRGWQETIQSPSHYIVAVMRLRKHCHRHGDNALPANGSSED